MWRFMFMAAGLASALSVQQASPAAKRSLDDVAWLAGCWEQAAEGRQVDEVWMKPAGGVMLGMSRTVARGRMVASEQLQLREEGGGVFYVAKPSNQAEARFELVEVKANHAKFANPAHDFPQAIIYTLGQDGALVARIKGRINGEPRTVRFPMRRGAC